MSDATDAKTGVRTQPRLWHLDVAFVLLTCVVFNDVIFSGARLVARDLLHYLYPIGVSLGDAWRANGSFVWDGGIDHGLPVVARWSPAVFYPLHVLFSIAPPNAVITVGLLAHLPLAASAAMRLALRHASDIPSAWLTGLAYAFGGYVFSMIGGAMYLYGAALLPLSLLSFHRLIERPTAFRTLQLALVLTMQVFCADPQTLFYETVFVLPVVALTRRSEGALRLRVVAAALTAGAAAIGLSACQWLPAIEFAPHSIRAGGLGIPDALTWSFHPIRTAEFLVPYLFGALTPENTYWARSLVDSSQSIPWAPSVYLGLLPVVGVAFAPFRRERLHLGGIAGMTVFFLLLSMGGRTPLGPLLLQVLPGADMFRYPEKFMLFVTLGIALLGGAGLSQLRSDSASAPGRGPRLRIRTAAAVFVLLGVAALTAIAVLKPGSPQTLSWFTGIVEGQRAGVDPAKALDTVAFALERLVFFSAGFGLVFIALRRLRPATATGVLLLVAVVDILSAALSMRVFGNPEWLDREPSLCSLMPPPAEGLRPMIWRDQFLAYGEPVGVPQIGMRAERQREWEWNTLKPNVGSAFCVRYAEGYDAGKTMAHVRLMRAFGERHDRRLDVLGVQAIVSRPGALDPAAYPLVRHDDNLNVAVYRNPDPLPFLHAVSSVDIAAGPEDAVARVASADFPFRSSAVVESPTALPDHAGADRRASLVSYRAGRIEVDAEFEKPGYLIVMESHFPGWRAAANGGSLPVYRANGAFLAVEVPAGHSRLLFEFAPGSQRRANAVSMVSMVATLVLALWFGRSRMPRAGRRDTGIDEGGTAT